MTGGARRAAGQFVECYSAAFAASTISAVISFGRDASEAWLASSEIVFFGFMRPDIIFWFSGLIIRSDVEI